MKTKLIIKWIILVFLFSIASGCATVETQTPEPDVGIEPTTVPTDEPTEVETPAPTATTEPTAIPTSVPTDTPAPTSLTWNKVSEMPTPRFGHTTSVVDGKIYVIGGWGGPTKVEMFDPETGSWTAKADMPTGRLWLSSSVVDGKIYAIGGATGPEWQSPSLATVEMYDPATDTWTKKADMPTARDALGTITIDGKIFALGGWVFEQGAVDNFEIYDPATDTWTVHEDMPTAMESKVALLDGKIYVMGGGGIGENYERFDLEANSWSHFRGKSSDSVGSNLFPYGKMIIAFGGIYLHNVTPGSEVHIYDPATDTWERLDDMPFRGWWMSVNEVNGKIYIMGGSSQQNDVYADLERSEYPPPMAGVWEVSVEP